VVVVGDACQNVPLLADQGASMAGAFLLGERPGAVRECEIVATPYQHEQSAKP
jgi:hypothetical protein